MMDCLRRYVNSRSTSARHGWLDNITVQTGKLEELGSWGVSSVVAKGKGFLIFRNVENNTSHLRMVQEITFAALIKDLQYPFRRTIFPIAGHRNPIERSIYQAHLCSPPNAYLPSLISVIITPLSTIHLRLSQFPFPFCEKFRSKMYQYPTPQSPTS
jgi:hypothetical protein